MAIYTTHPWNVRLFAPARTEWLRVLYQNPVLGRFIQDSSRLQASVGTEIECRSYASLLSIGEIELKMSVRAARSLPLENAAARDRAKLQETPAWRSLYNREKVIPGHALKIGIFRQRNATALE